MGTLSSFEPYVSIIIPTYNRAGTIVRAIRSVFQQTYVSYELIVIDNGSTDCTGLLLKNTFPELATIRFETNQGIPAARNAGLVSARGDLIAFLDSDDEWHPMYLANQVSALAAQDWNATFSYCGAYTAVFQNKRFNISCRPRSEGDLVESLLINCFVHSMSQVIIPRSAFENVGMQLSENLSVCHDFELYLRLLAAGRPVRVEENLLTKFWLPDSTLFQDVSLWRKEYLQVLETFCSSPEGNSYVHIKEDATKTLDLSIAGWLHLFQTLVGSCANRVAGSNPGVY